MAPLLCDAGMGYRRQTRQDGSAGDAVSDTACLEPLGSLIAAALKPCQRSQILVSTIETNTIRMFFGNKKNRKTALGPALLEQLKKLLGEPSPAGANEWEFRLPLVVGYDRIARARVLPQPPTESGNSCYVRGWAGPGGGEHDLLGQAASPAVAFAAGYLQLNVVAGAAIADVRRSACIP